MFNFARFTVVFFLLSLFIGGPLGCSKSDNEASNPPASQAPNQPAGQPSPAPVPNSGVQCGAFPTGTETLSYCFQDRFGQYTRSTPRIIYFFHGLGGSPNDIFGAEGRQILDGFARIFGNQMPIIASISTGAGGVLGDDTPEILNNGLPALEAIMIPGKSPRRLVMGGSLGGHNSLRLVAQAPDRFTAVAALCLALATFNGYNQAEIDAYIQRNRSVIDVDFLNRALVAYRQELKTPEMWTANNPFTLLETGVYDRIPIFISVGREDTVGFVEGSREFKRRMDLRPGTNVSYYEARGPHCVFDIPSMLRFVFKHL